MAVRLLIIWCLGVMISCTSKSPAPMPAIERLSGRVVDASGPRGGARVRLLALKSMPCPCSEARAEVEAVDVCACADSLRAQQQRRVGGCEKVVLAETTSSETGTWELPLRDGGTTLEAVVEGASRWLTFDDLRHDITLELAPIIDAVVSVTAPAGAAPPRVTAMYEDGRCETFVKKGDAFVARSIDREGVLLVEAQGLTPLQTSLAESVEVVLRPPTTVRGICESASDLRRPPYRVVWDARYQAQTVQSDARGTFAFENVLQTPATVTCWHGERKVSAFMFEPGEPELLQLSDTDPDDDADHTDDDAEAGCRRVTVVDQHGKPVVGATVEVQPPEYDTFSTDKTGVACVAGMDVVIIAPDSTGGRCAGSRAVDLAMEALQRPDAPIVLPLKPVALSRAPFIGRVVDASGAPVAGASVVIESITSSDDDGDCGLPEPEAVETRADGTFKTTPVFSGVATVTVSHRLHATRTHTLGLPATRPDLALGQTARWKGRMLELDGRPVARAKLSGEGAHPFTEITADDGAFELRTLEPGRFDLQARLQNGNCFTGEYHFRRTLKGGDARVEDLVLPGPTVTLSGRVAAKTQCKCVGARRVNESEEPTFAVGAQLGPDGRFTIERLMKGRWRINACGLETITEVPLASELVLR